MVRAGHARSMPSAAPQGVHPTSQKWSTGSFAHHPTMSECGNGRPSTRTCQGLWSKPLRLGVSSRGWRERGADRGVNVAPLGVMITTGVPGPPVHGRPALTVVPPRALRASCGGMLGSIDEKCSTGRLADSLEPGCEPSSVTSEQTS